VSPPFGKRLASRARLPPTFDHPPPLPPPLPALIRWHVPVAVVVARVLVLVLVAVAVLVRVRGAWRAAAAAVIVAVEPRMQHVNPPRLARPCPGSRTSACSSRFPGPTPVVLCCPARQRRPPPPPPPPVPSYRTPSFPRSHMGGIPVRGPALVLGVPMPMSGLESMPTSMGEVAVAAAVVVALLILQQSGWGTQAVQPPSNPRRRPRC